MTGRRAKQAFVDLRMAELIAVVSTEFGENNGHCAVQRHSISPILVPIKSP